MAYALNALMKFKINIEAIQMTKYKLFIMNDWFINK